MTEIVGSAGQMDRPSALLFDMDGTLTAPMLDFPLIKQEMGIGERAILEALNDMTSADRRAAEAILHRHERQAAERSRLNDGCHDLLRWIAEAGIATALITRNARQSAETVLKLHGLSFPCLITREDGPFKPDPAPLRLACAQLSVNIELAWMIGDGQFDVEAGNAAGAKTIWISHGRSRTFSAEPWRTLRDLNELATMLKACERRCD